MSTLKPNIVKELEAHGLEVTHWPSHNMDGGGTSVTTNTGRIIHHKMFMTEAKAKHLIKWLNAGNPVEK